MKVKLKPIDGRRVSQVLSGETFSHCGEAYVRVDPFNIGSKLAVGTCCALNFETAALIGVRW
jgi:hypothetical protein